MCGDEEVKNAEIPRSPAWYAWRRERGMEDRYYIGREPMRSGLAEQAHHAYKLHVGKHHLWLVADVENPGDYVYSWRPNDTMSEGFGGRALTFELSNGRGKLTLQGPWHSNSQALLSDTGINVQDLHYTWVCIAERRDHEEHQTYYEGILHQDGSWVLGSFYRGVRLAEEHADRLGKVVFCYSRNQGGSNDQPVYPLRPCEKVGDKYHERAITHTVNLDGSNSMCRSQCRGDF